MEGRPSDWPGSICGCCNYVHPYKKTQFSAWWSFLYSCICPLSLAANEKALHELSYGRGGAAAGQLCAGDSTGASPERAACSLAATAWLALLPLLWPFLAFLSFAQRRHVVKSFRVTPEVSHPVGTAVRAVLCMPCSLWQVSVFLNERSYEEQFHRKWAASDMGITQDQGEDSRDSESQESRAVPQAHHTGHPSNSYVQRLFSVTQSDPGSGVPPTAPSLQVMERPARGSNESAAVEASHPTAASLQPQLSLKQAKSASGMSRISAVPSSKVLEAPGPKPSPGLSTDALAPSLGFSQPTARGTSSPEAAQKATGTAQQASSPGRQRVSVNSSQSDSSRSMHQVSAGSQHAALTTFTTPTTTPAANNAAPSAERQSDHLRGTLSALQRQSVPLGEDVRSRPASNTSASPAVHGSAPWQRPHTKQSSDTSPAPRSDSSSPRMRPSTGAYSTLEAEEPLPAACASGPWWGTQRAPSLEEVENADVGSFGVGDGDAEGAHQRRWMRVSRRVDVESQDVMAIGTLPRQPAVASACRAVGPASRGSGMHGAAYSGHAGPSSAPAIVDNLHEGSSLAPSDGLLDRLLSSRETASLMADARMPIATPPQLSRGVGGPSGVGPAHGGSGSPNKERKLLKSATVAIRSRHKDLWSRAARAVEANKTLAAQRDQPQPQPQQRPLEAAPSVSAAGNMRGQEELDPSTPAMKPAASLTQDPVALVAAAATVRARHQQIWKRAAAVGLTRAADNAPTASTPDTTAPPNAAPLPPRPETSIGEVGAASGQQAVLQWAHHAHKSSLMWKRAPPPKTGTSSPAESISPMSTAKGSSANPRRSSDAPGSPGGGASSALLHQLYGSCMSAFAQPRPPSSLPAKLEHTGLAKEDIMKQDELQPGNDRSTMAPLSTVHPASSLQMHEVTLQLPGITAALTTQSSAPDTEAPLQHLSTTKSGRDRMTTLSTLGASDSDMTSPRDSYHISYADSFTEGPSHTFDNPLSFTQPAGAYGAPGAFPGDAHPVVNAADGGLVHPSDVGAYPAAAPSSFTDAQLVEAGMAQARMLQARSGATAPWAPGGPMQETEPGIVGNVEDSGVLDARGSVELRHEMWQPMVPPGHPVGQHRRGHPPDRALAQHGLPQRVEHRVLSPVQEGVAVEHASVPSPRGMLRRSDARESGRETSSQLLRRMSAVLREANVRVPDTNTHHVNVDELIELHDAETAVQSQMMSTRNSTLSDLDF